MGSRYRFSGGRVDRVRDARKRSLIRPFRDEEQAHDPNYVASLPAPNEGKKYFGRDVTDPEEGVQLFTGVDEDDPDAEEVGSLMPPGSYTMRGEGDAHRHIFRQGQDEPQNIGSKPIESMPSALAELNRTQDVFWKRQYQDGGLRVPSNVAAAAEAVRAVMKDRGITGDSAMIGQRSLAGLNALHRKHYTEQGHGGAQDTSLPKGGSLTAAQINQMNRARWRQR
jgi:hypothetical protein